MQQAFVDETLLVMTLIQIGEKKRNPSNLEVKRNDQDPLNN